MQWRIKPNSIHSLYRPKQQGAGAVKQAGMSNSLIQNIQHDFTPQDDSDKSHDNSDKSALEEAPLLPTHWSQGTLPHCQQCMKETWEHQAQERVRPLAEGPWFDHEIQQRRPSRWVKAWQALHWPSKEIESLDNNDNEEEPTDDQLAAEMDAHDIDVNNDVDVVDQAHCQDWSMQILFDGRLYRPSKHWVP